MRWVLFWIFSSAFVIILIATIGAVFFGLGALQPDERQLLMKAFFVEISIAVCALFYSLFGIKQQSSMQSDSTAGVLRSPTLEQKHQLSRIPIGKILCAASSQHFQMNVQGDISALKQAFGRNLKSPETDITASQLRELLSQSPYSIIHLVCYVDPNTGDATFSKMDLEKKTPLTEEVDKLSSDGLATLLRLAQVKLIVLATCDALLLAVQLSRVTNVIAANGYISGKAFPSWATVFYQLLAEGHPLTEAYEDACKTTGVPMLLLRNKEFMFE
jgi:hypothetical protein